MHCKYLPFFQALEKFSKALYGTTGGTYSPRVFRPVMTNTMSDEASEVVAASEPPKKKESTSSRAEQH